MDAASSKSRRLRAAMYSAGGRPLQETVNHERYFAHALLGEGGQGTVYLASADSQANTQLVALKVFHGAGQLSDRARIEQSLAAQFELLEHGVRGVPEVVAYDFPTDEEPWVATSFFGGSLQSHPRVPCGPRVLLLLAHSLSRTLSEAHRAGILHRDVKPANVLLSDRRKSFGPDFALCDFDLAKAWVGGPSLTTPGVGLGSRHYSAPEQLLGSERASPASDAFSLAATLVFAASGQSPGEIFTGFYDPNVRLELPSALRDALGPCAEWVERALAFRPDARPEIPELSDLSGWRAQRVGRAGPAPRAAEPGDGDSTIVNPS